MNATRILAHAKTHGVDLWEVIKLLPALKDHKDELLRALWKAGSQE